MIGHVIWTWPFVLANDVLNNYVVNQYFRQCMVEIGKSGGNCIVCNSDRLKQVDIRVIVRTKCQYPQAWPGMGVQVAG